MEHLWKDYFHKQSLTLFYFKTVLVEEECLPLLDQLLLKHENVEVFLFFVSAFLSTSPESLTNSATSPQVSPATDRNSSVHSVHHVDMENDDDGGGVGDASSHSETEGDNAKSQRLLGNYFARLNQSGTTRRSNCGTA